MRTQCGRVVVTTTTYPPLLYPYLPFVPGVVNGAGITRSLVSLILQWQNHIGNHVDDSDNDSANHRPEESVNTYPHVKEPGDPRGQAKHHRVHHDEE